MFRLEATESIFPEQHFLYFFATTTGTGLVPAGVGPRSGQGSVRLGVPTVDRVSVNLVVADNPGRRRWNANAAPPSRLSAGAGAGAHQRVSLLFLSHCHTDRVVSQGPLLLITEVAENAAHAARGLHTE